MHWQRDVEVVRNYSVLVACIDEDAGLEQVKLSVDDVVGEKSCSLVCGYCETVWHPRWLID